MSEDVLLEKLLDERRKAFEYQQAIGSASTYGQTPEARAKLELEWIRACQALSSASEAVAKALGHVYP